MPFFTGVQNEERLYQRHNQLDDESSQQDPGSLYSC
jgi:hypothetical protein